MYMVFLYESLCVCLYVQELIAVGTLFLWEREGGWFLLGSVECSSVFTSSHARKGLGSHCLFGFGSHTCFDAR